MEEAAAARAGLSRLDLGVLIVLVSMGDRRCRRPHRGVRRQQRHRSVWNRLRRRPPDLSSRSHDRVRPRVSCAAPVRSARDRRAGRCRPLGRPLPRCDLARHRRRDVWEGPRHRGRLGVVRSAHARAGARRPAARQSRPLALSRRDRRIPACRHPRLRADHLIRRRREGRGRSDRDHVHRRREPAPTLAAVLVVLASLWFAALATSRVEEARSPRR